MGARKACYRYHTLARNEFVSNRFAAGGSCVEAGAQRR